VCVKVLQEPWSSLPILQEPEARDAVAVILQAKAEAEARKVLTAIGLTEEQSRLFLALSNSSSSANLRASLSSTASEFATTASELATSAKRAAQALDIAATADGVRVRDTQRSALNATNMYIYNATSRLALAALTSSSRLSSNASALTYSVNLARFLESAVSSRYSERQTDNPEELGDTISWKELWVYLFGDAKEWGGEGGDVTLRGAPSSSLRFLESVQSQVAVSPVLFGLLRDAALLTVLNDTYRLSEGVLSAGRGGVGGLEESHGLTAAVGGEIKAALANLSQSVDESFKALVRHRLPDSMRSIYYTPEGRERGLPDADASGGGERSTYREGSTCPGPVQRKLVALPILDWGFQALSLQSSLDQMRSSWKAGVDRVVAGVSVNGNSSGSRRRLPFSADSAKLSNNSSNEDKQ
jgi:hypothetical protein